MNPESWTLAVLAGGASTRMGSDKASRPFAGGTLLDHAIARYAPPGQPVLVSRRAEEGQWEEGGRLKPAVQVKPAVQEVLDDESGLGPLAGIAALVERAPAPFLLIVPVDLPLFPARCGEVMAAAADGAPALALSWKGRVEPFPVLVSRGVAPLLKDLLGRGLRRADGFHEPARARVVPFEDLFAGFDPEIAFLNVNTPSELSRAEALLASGGR